MKKVLFALVSIFLFNVAIQAQKAKVMNDPTHDDKPIHFGFSLGLNFMDFGLYQSQWAKDNGYYADISTLNPGINIQAIANLRLTEYWDLRSLPGISFGERHVNFIKLNAGENGGDSIMYDGEPYRMESSFLELPISLKYKAKRMNNFRPYLIGGGNIRYDLAVKRDYNENEQLFMISPLDVYAELGMGFDFYLVYFKFGLEFKYSVGLTNIFRSTNPSGNGPNDENLEPYTNMLDRLNSHIFTISFHFE